MKNKIKMLDNNIKNSKFQIAKNMLRYMIAPAVILLVGIILLCTVGFNGGTQLYGGSTFTIYINSEDKIASAETYNLDEDYGFLCNKISSILAEGNMRAESFQKTQMDIEGVDAAGQAIKVIYQNSTADIEKIHNENDAIKNRMMAEFGYSTQPDAVTDADHFEGTMSISWALTLIASIIFAATVIFVYMAIRSRSASWLLGLIHVVMDLSVFASLLLICRIPVGFTVGISTIVCAVLSIANIYAFYAKARKGIANGEFNNLKPTKMADITAKSMIVKKAIIYVAVFIMSFILMVMPFGGICETGLGALMALIITFYTSTFILPAIWAASYSPEKKKKTNKKEA